MQGKHNTSIRSLLKTRDELSLRNLRFGMWPLLLIFPLTVIMGDLRYYDLHIKALNLESYELMLFPLGLGWLVLAFTPKKMIIPFLRIAALMSAILLPFEIFIPNPMGKLVFFMIFQFLNGLCAACGFYLFCFELKNVERLFSMVLVQFYYGFYYTIWRAFPAVEAMGKTWGSAAVMAVYLAVVFSCSKNKLESSPEIDNDRNGTAVFFIIGLDIIYYIIMCMINYIEWAENSVSSLAFGLGAFASIILVIIIQLLNNRSALYIWLLFLALSLLGLGALLYDSPITLVSGSFAYGLGDGLGYIIIYYICASVLKQVKSCRMFRLFCVKFFIEYFVISGIFSIAFTFFEAPNKILAFGVVLVLGSLCLLLMPLMQKKLFEADWTDGLFLQDMAEYSSSLTEVKAIDIRNKLHLTSREQEIFTMLLAGKAPKEIAYILRISYDTVLFHQKNLYRKLGIQSRAELFAKYS